MSIDIENILIQYEERYLNSTNDDDKFNYLNLIINVKRDNNINCYKEFKKYIDLYLMTLKGNIFKYDSFDFDQIKKKLSFFSDEEQNDLYNYLKIKLIQDNNESDLKKVKNEINIIQLRLIKKAKFWFFRPKSVFKFLLIISSFNILSIVLSMILMFILEITILLPTNNINHQFFKISYIDYSDFYIWNHILNILSYTFEIDSEIKIVPVNFLGLFIMIFIKIIKWSVILNYLVKNLQSKIEI
ncbi:MAG: hypothetical protein V4620_12150 [Bacteroidota bacterium]